MSKVVNAATGQKYPFVQGSIEERTLFRVTPVEALAAGAYPKLYFDSKEQYLAWRGAKLHADKSLRVFVIPGLVYKPSCNIVQS
jgi:hypothetical protein